MTSEAIEALGFDSTNPETCLFVEAALDWLCANTTLEFDKSDIESLKALPAGAKLFLRRYGSIMQTDTTVTSESIGGMSQSFSTSSKNNLLMDLANDLLNMYMKSSFSFIPAVEKWA